MTNNTPVTARWIKLFFMLFFFLDFLFCFYGFLLFFLLRFFQFGSSLVCTDFFRTSFPPVRSRHTLHSQQYKLTENNKKHKQIIKYKHIIKQINKNNGIKTQKCIDKYPQRCYYKTIKNNKRKTKKKIIQFIA